MRTCTRTGQDTLHGGIYGWDRRNWTVLARTGTSVTYHHLDAADEGFPGDVDATVRSSPSPFLLPTFPFNSPPPLPDIDICISLPPYTSY